MHLSGRSSQKKARETGKKVKDNEKPKQHLETQPIGHRSRIGGHGLHRSGAEHNLESGRPFEFSVNRASNLPPGNYNVVRDNSVWVISSRNHCKSVLIVPIAVQVKQTRSPRSPSSASGITASLPLSTPVTANWDWSCRPVG